MKHERIQLAFKLIFSHLVIIPIILGSSLFIGNDLFLILSITQTVLLILFFSGYWEFFGLTFRLIYCACIEAILIGILLLKIPGRVSTEFIGFFTILLAIIQIFLIYVLIKIFVAIFRKEKNRLEIEFPFNTGKYLITDGGNSKISRIMNYHFHSAIHKKNKTNYSMMFATDIVRLDGKNKGFMPRNNESYPIFENTVISPIQGRIVRVVNDIDDNIPYCGNYPYNTGNTIVIQRDDLYLLLGHLRKGSIRVSVGDLVNENDQLALAGNSGYSERPHLHFQLIQSSTANYWTGRGISMQFRTKNLFKNRVVELQKSQYIYC